MTTARVGMTNGLARRLRTIPRVSAVLLVAVIAALVGFGVARQGFLTQSNILSIAQQTAVISLVAFGMTVVILTRGIDLSVGSSLAFAGVVGGQVMRVTNGSAVLTIGAIFATALLVGALNGLLIAVLHVNAFMATLGTYALVGGAAIGLSNGASIDVGNSAIRWLGSADIGGVPISVIVTLVVLAMFYVLLRRTVLGGWFYATGGNRNAAVASGIPVRLVEFTAYVVTGLVVGLGSLLTIGRVSSVQPLAGQGLEFSAITAAVIGGTSLAGGRGDVIGTFLGSIFVGIVSAGLSFLGVDQSLIYLFTGVLVVIAVLISQREVFAVLRERYVTARTLARNAVISARRRRDPGSGAESGPEGGRHELRVEDVRKQFAGVTALKSVDLTVESGEVVALMGENGAGKSTLVKVLAGNHRPTSGTVRIDGRPVDFSGPEDSRRAGIAVIHQHFTLVSDLTVAENMFLGEEPRWTRFGPLRRGYMRAVTRDLLAELDIPVSADALIAELSVGHRQMIEIANAVHKRAWLVIMDEPTSALSSRERDHLYQFIERLRTRDTAILYISHKLDEIFHLASRAVVLRDGAVVGRPRLDEVQPEQLVSLMVGRSIENVFPHVPAPLGEKRLVVNELSDGGVLRNASLTVRSGEVVGLVGLMGSGRTEMFRCIVGLSATTHGQIQILDHADGRLSINKLAERGVAFVPEDRLDEGIFPELTVGENISMLWTRYHSLRGFRRARAERSFVTRSIKQLGVRPADPAREIQYLSGGNQQKVVLGRWLALAPKLVLLDDPTRGVDVGAKAEIHALIADLKLQGAAVLLTSSEMPEVLSVADRVVVMRNGATVREYPRGVDEEQVMRDAFGDQAATPLVSKAGPMPIEQDARADPYKHKVITNE